MPQGEDRCRREGEERAEGQRQEHTVSLEDGGHLKWPENILSGRPSPPPASPPCPAVQGAGVMGGGGLAQTLHVGCSASCPSSDPQQLLDLGLACVSSCGRRRVEGCVVCPVEGLL